MRYFMKNCKISRSWRTTPEPLFANKN